ncbi:MAG: hypothetical protein IPI88_02400 [Chitinophagaceae bacterium]|nr:hypothetical protein [Chitinophagaceae bacterium]
MKKALLLTLFFALIVTFGFSQTDKYWSANSESRSSIITAKGVARQSFPKEFKLFNLNTESLRKELFSIVGSSAKRQTVISLPNANGGFEEFEVNEASNFEPALQARYPEIRAYSGRGITDRAATLKLSISPQGIQTMVFRAGQANEFIEPYSKDLSVYAVFKSQRAKGQLQWTCSTPEEKMVNSLNAKVATSGLTGSSAGELKTMRLAQSCNAEYSNYFGATSIAQIALVYAAFNATLTRTNGCYEKDLALHLNLIANSFEDQIIFFNPATDPYTTLGNWNNELQALLTAVVTDANYDIGHMFGASGGGGNAGCIGCVCVAGIKGRGITSPADNIPEGDNFDIDYVAHEVGHQLGGNHTFSMSNEGLGQNKEVGSGITIMGYAGITSQDVAPHSIDIFHETSIQQIQVNLATKTCPVTTNITANNATPVVAPVANVTIPISTPFALTGSATDANPGDVLTYCWEQDQDGSGQTGNNSRAYPTKPSGPNWLTFPATTSPTRLFPRLSTILAGLNVTPVLPGGDAIADIEALSSVGRTLNFRLTVRDNASYVADPPASRKVAQTAFTDVTVTVSAAAGPFQVTQPNTNVSWAGGSTQTITWDVNNTTAAPVSCANVKISLSTDGGTTFPTVLVASTANDGTESVTIPSTPSTTARIKVEAVGNIFFDISNTNFNITGAATAPVVTINQAAAQVDPTSTSPINFTVVFDQPVTGFATGDVTLSGTAGATTGTVTGSGTTYNVAVTGMGTSGTVIATIAAGVCQNASAQTNNASTSTDNTVTYNLVVAAPTVTINQAAAQVDPTSASTINFTVVFDQNVTGFATGDVTLSGTAGATTGTVTGSGTTYNVAVTGMTGSGTVIATVPAGVCQNASAQNNLASTSTDNTVTYNAPPGCTSVDPVPNQIVCNNAATTAVNFTSGTPGTTFSWVNNTPSIGLAANGTGNIPSFIATNATALPVTATVTVTPILTIVTPTTTIYNFTGSAQTFTVPAGVSSINITTLGAEGGAGAIGAANGGGPAGGAGGRGSRATGTLAVTPGQVLTIFVGGAGGAPTAGFNGGGTGGSVNAGGGGGASDVRFPGASSADRVIVAAGGGGGGRGGCEGSIGAPGAGGAGGNGDGNGANGGDSPTGVGVAGGGFGAIGVVPGLQGIGCAGFLGAPGLASAGPAGGNGGAGQSCCCFNFASVPGGGGGGGGFLGGAGGGGGSAGTVLCAGNDKGAGGGGAGGTSFTGGVTAGAITTNIQTGNGQVVLNYNVTTVCNGPTTAFTITVNPTATVNVVPDQTLCAGSPTLPVNFTSPTAGVIFNWTNNTPAIGLAAAGTGNIPSFIAQNPGNTPLVATITVTPLVPVGGSIPGGPVSFTNTASIAIPGTGTGSGTGSAANPYPSNITVSGLPTTGVSVQSVTLTNIQHTWSDDIGVLLVGPGGQKFVPMARVGGSGGFDASATVILRDGSPAMPTGTAAIPSGTYAPTAGAAGAIWPAPAPAAPYSYPAPNGSATFANTFNTTSNYNGTWSLYVTDMAAGDVGTIAGGWGITLVTPTIPAPGCNGTPRTFTITVNPNPAIVIVADPGTTLCEGDPTLLTVVTGTATPLGTLYTQTGAAGASPNSQAFEPANVAFNNQAAEDFVVPAGSTWTISQVSANGLYFNGAGPSTSFNVSFYNNAGGIPGSLVASYTNLAYTGGASPVITVPNTVLPAGTYWVSIQSNMSFAAGGQWAWGAAGATATGSPWAWQNPGGGFAVCPTWGNGAVTCIPGTDRNLLFTLTGTSVTGGGPLVPGYTFLWSPALGLSSTTSNPVAASPMNTTTYTVVRTTPGGCTRTAQVTITVNKRPVVTTQPANNVRCAGTNAVFTVGATGTGLTYQWQESLTGCPGTTWTNLPNAAPYVGVNTPTLTITAVTGLLSGRAYRCIVTGVCAPWNPPTNISNCATLTVNPLPVVSISPAGPVCGGVAGISGTQLSTASAPPPVPGSVTVNSGAISIAIPDNNPAGVSSNLTVAGIPANATITGARATWTMPHTWNGDMVFVLKSPNGSILNLDYYLSATGGAGVTTGFVNTTVSSTGVNALSSGTGTYTGTFKADANIAVVPPFGATGPTGSTPTVSTWTPMFTPIPNGTWTLAMYDGGNLDQGTLTNWTITVDYTTPGTTTSTLSYVWSPVTGLYNDAQATIPYTGTNTPVVYAAPTALTTYTVTATDIVTGCVSTASVLVNYTPPAPTVTPNPVTMCLGDPAVKLKSSSSSSATGTFCSGTVNVTIPDGPGIPPVPTTYPATTSNITVSGIPAGATITAVRARFNITHAWVSDLVMALKAPNGSIVNLDAMLNRTNQAGANFTNTVISSTSTTTLGGTAPYTGTFADDAAGATFVAFGFTFPGGPVGYVPTTQQYADLYNTGSANGVWSVGIYDAGAPDAGVLNNWCIEIDYTLGVPATPAVWSPATGLFSNAAGTIPYVAGTAVDSVWAAPTTIGANNYQVTVQSLPAFLPVPPSFTNPASITIVNGATTPYPSNLVVSGLPTTGVTVQSVILNGLSHTWSDDVDILLQHPNGTTNVILMSDVGGASVTTNATYTFQDGSPAMGTGANPTGTYRPTNLVGTLGVEPDNFPAPGPGAVTQPTPTLASFTGDMNGTWKLFAVDDFAGDNGTLAGGYTIRFNVPVAPCTSPARTVVVTVNQPTVLNANIPVNQTICTDKVATFTTAVATGSGPHSYQWQVSTNNGVSWTNVANGGVYSGATTATLTVTAPPVSMNGYQYRAIVTGAAPCAAQTSRVATLTVNPLPVIVISAAPYTSLLPGLQTTLSSTVTPNPAGANGYSWLRNGVVLSSPALGVVSVIGTGSLRLDVDGQGDYQLRVTDVNGCTNISNTITIKDSASGKCFIYPNPTSGKFQVRYYSVANNVLPRFLTIYDSKGDRVFVQNYTIGRPYDRMDVDMRAFGKGLYWVEIGDLNGNRLTMCRVVIQ